MGFKFRNEPKVEHFLSNSVKKNRISYILVKENLIYLIAKFNTSIS
jgi:hypothetical protein